MIRYLLGIDLGTTNSALAYIDVRDPKNIRSFRVPQLVAPGETAPRDLLPSFLYLPGEHDLPAGAAALPWDAHASYVVGEFARDHGAQFQDYKGKRFLVLTHKSDHQEPTAVGEPSDKVGVMAFLEPGLVAVGDLNSVQRAIDAQLSGQSITGNDEMMSLVTDIERSNNAWAVGRFDIISAQAKLPEQIARQIPPVKWFAAAGHINGGVSAQVRAEANDDQAAENLRGVLNGVISLARLQGQNDPKLASLIQSLQLSGSGKTVQLSVDVPAEIFELMAPKVQVH